MKRLKELQSLITMSRALGQEPDISLIEEYDRLRAQQDKIEARVKKNIAEDLNDIFSQSTVTEDIPVLENEEMWSQRVIDEQPILITRIAVPESNPEVILEVPDVATQVADSIGRQMASEGTVVRPEAEMPAPTAALEQKIKYLENWISRIAATGPGGGAAQIYNLDIPVKTVTGDYTIGRKDYYVGVSSTVKTYITLPTTGANLKDGRVIVIKDESGHAQLTPIKLVGTIDNDPNGAEIRINNGAVQLVWRTDGWRII